MNKRLFMIPALIVTAAMVLAGCNSNDTVASTNATETVETASVVPSLQDIRGAVTLDDADAAVVEKALADWRKTAQTARKDGPMAMHRGGMEFVAAVAPSLDNTQLSDLAGYLVSLRETHRQEQQGRMRGDREGGKRFESMIKELGLTADQQKQLRALHEEMQAQMKQARDSRRAGTISDEDFRTVRDAFHDTQRAKLAGILTADQLKKHDELRDQRRDKMMDRRADRMDNRVDTQLTWLTAVLNLDDAQQAQVRTVLESAAQSHKAAMETRRNGDGDRAAARTQMRDARDKTHDAIRALLTEQQQERLTIVESLRGPGPHRP